MLRRLRGEHLVVAYAVVAVAGLIVLRALVDALGFIGIGWILVLAALPLVPWLLPRLGEFLKTISPYVQTLRLGALEVDLRAVRREAISVPSHGILAAVPNDVAALTSGTAIKELLEAVRGFRARGAGPVVVIDLRDGQKWLLPNLYFLTRLLESDSLVSLLVFTESRGGRDGYVVGSCSPAELRRRVEETIPAYASGAGVVPAMTARELDNPRKVQAIGTTFGKLLQALGQAPAGANGGDPRGWVTSERVRAILSGVVSTTAIEAAATLSDEDVHAVVHSPYRYVPVTTESVLSGLIDREAVAVAVARAALSQA